MIVEIENPKYSTKCYESKQIHIEKICCVLIHLTSPQNPNPIYNFIKIIKYLKINLTKEVKELYTGNYMILMKESEKNPHK